MLWLISLLSYVLVQTLGLVIAFIAAAVLLYIILRRFHSRPITLLLCTIFLGISIFFYVPNGLPNGFEYAAFLTSYGPAGSPALPFSNVINFFLHVSQFEKVLRVRGQGVGPRGGRRGDLLVKVLIKNPTKLSKKAKGLIDELRQEGL
jgi:hypothetical protein